MTSTVLAGEAPGVEATIAARRSVRAFRPEPVAEADLAALLGSACWAPSPHNAQPWRFVVLTTPSSRNRLAQQMADKWAVDLRRDGLADEQIRPRVERRRRRLAEAPAAIVACLVAADLDEYPDSTRSLAEWATGVQSLGAAVQNLLLAAQARGLGSCWVCAPIFCPEVVRTSLDLDPGWEPHALVLLGYAQAPVNPRPRRGPAELAVWR